MNLLEVFDKVWRRVLISTSKQSGISGSLLNLLCDFFKFRVKQADSSWTDVDAAVPQESILSSLITLEIHSNAVLFIGDTSSFFLAHDIHTFLSYTNENKNYI